MLFTTVVIATTVCSAASDAPAALYNQCGGENWTGATTCVSGAVCQYQNPYYSQCVASTSASSAISVATSSATSAASVATSSVAAASSAPAATSTAVVSSTAAADSSTAAVESTTADAESSTATSSAKKSSTSSAATSGTTYIASFTQYGEGDDNGSGNCNVLTTACGFYTSPGYSAAVSQALFGVGPGAGAGPDCGLCYKLTAETDSSGTALSNAGNSIIVEVTNLCPADGNPLCAQSTTSDTNQYGANVNFDLCIQSGANTALFGDSGVELAVGTAVQVSCSEYSGTVVS